MIGKKEGFPGEGDLVLCTVKKVLYHSVFVELDEYQGLEGFIHISEIAPGRIRNIRDYVKEGKKIVCKVLKINKEKGNIDVSLRRVSVQMRNKKNTEDKQEQKAGKILDTLAKECNTSVDNIYKDIGESLIENYGSIYEGFQKILLNGEQELKSLKSDEKLKKKLFKIIKDRIKPVEVSLNGVLTMSSYSSNGIDEVKQTLLDLIKENNDYKIKIQYISAPKYKILISASNYKKAEKGAEIIMKYTEEFVNKYNGVAEFKRL